MQELKKLSITYYLYTIFRAILFSYVFGGSVSAIFLNYNGIPANGIFLALASYGLFNFLLEVPSGAIADKFNKRNILVFAPFLVILQMLLFVVSKGNLGIVILGVLSASIGASLISGTDKALVYERLKELNMQKEWHKISSHNRAYRQFIQGFFLFFGGYIGYKVGIDWVMILSMIPMFFAAIVALNFPRDIKTSSTEEAQNIKYRYHFVNLWKEFVNNINYRNVLLLTIVVEVTLRVTDEYVAVSFKEVGFNLMQIGLLVAIGNVFTSIGSLASYKFKNYNCEVLLLVLGAIAFVGVATLPLYGMIACIYLCSMIFPFLRVRTTTKIQHSIENVSRATITSFNHLAVNVFAMVYFAIISKFLKIESFSVVFIMLTFMILAYLLFLTVQRLVKRVQEA